MIQTSSTTRYVYYCGNSVTNVVHDHIYEAVAHFANGQWQFSPPKDVFGPQDDPSPTGFFAYHACEPEVIGRLHLGTAEKLVFPDHSFDCVLCLNTVHNFPRPRAIKVMQEIERVSGGRAFVQVDSYHTPEQKEIFESWVLTAEFYDYPQGWIELFREAGYTGDYYWTIIE